MHRLMSAATSGMSLAAIGGLLVGGICFVAVGCPFTTVETVGEPLQLAATFQPSWNALLITTLTTVAIIVATLCSPVEEIWTRFYIALGIGFLATGLWWQCRNRIVVHADGFDVSTAFTVLPRRYNFGGGNHVFQKSEARPWSRFGARHSVHFMHANGLSEVLCHDTRRNPLWTFAAPHLMRASKVPRLDVGSSRTTGHNGK